MKGTPVVEHRWALAAMVCAAVVAVGCHRQPGVMNPALEEIGPQHSSPRALGLLRCPAPEVLQGEIREEAGRTRVAEYAATLAEAGEVFGAELARTFDVMELSLDPASACPNFDRPGVIWGSESWVFDNPHFQEAIAKVATAQGASTIVIPVIHAVKIKCLGARVVECWEEDVRLGLLLFDDSGELLWKNHKVLTFQEPSRERTAARRAHTREVVEQLMKEIPFEEIIERRQAQTASR